ncbi:hypothetical protein Q2T40_17935 [Winogradskyella maritima]|uniref:Prophage protein DUF1660 n=1 Tax=Winogradskyella maritima TaxID=1517766 RepID=A0ABV8AIB0_9FLAO|nr:hypothetical protein [Winogradskyella maritima]
MNNSTNALTPTKLYCDIFGHNYEMSKQVTYHVKEYTCKCCKKQMTTDGNGRLTELTPKFKEINSILSRIYANKMNRMRSRAFQTTAA